MKIESYGFKALLKILFIRVYIKLKKHVQFVRIYDIQYTVYTAYTVYCTCLHISVQHTISI